MFIECDFKHRKHVICHVIFMLTFEKSMCFFFTSSVDMVLHNYMEIIRINVFIFDLITYYLSHYTYIYI